jgi:hypothetical protein
VSPRTHWTLGLGFVALGACSTPSSAPLQPSDLEPIAGRTFRAAVIIESDAEFQDAARVDEASIQAFLQKTPYGGTSFLATYASEGLLASASIRRAAAKHQINPIIILAKLQEAQGLIGERYYPDESSRVEFVFGCGCNGRGTCDAAFAGVSRQVDCFAANLRASLNSIAEERPTLSGIAPNQAFTTLDGVRVAPQNAATTAVYVWEPRVGVGARAAWVLWNLWGKYAKAMKYIAPPEQQVIGGPCELGVSCKGDKFVCLPRPSGGVCSARCANSAACDPEGTGSAVCANLNASGQEAEGYCLLRCDEGGMDTCPSDLKCDNRAELGASTTFVCVAP